jgi:hypothetical protein
MGSAGRREFSDGEKEQRNAAPRLPLRHRLPVRERLHLRACVVRNRRAPLSDDAAHARSPATAATRRRAFAAMLTMKKVDVAAIEAARRG